MLSPNVPRTPRPRPPAKVRRSSSQPRDWSFPPPYERFEPLPTLLGSPISATSLLIRQDEPFEDQVQERSKEELEELLRRASRIIKEREQELDLTSATCKTLAENNAALKTRNDALKSRLPSSQSSSPLPSPLLGPEALPSPSLSRGSTRSLILSPTPSLTRRRPRHARRISKTPVELATLADQNAELLAKLADLEAEATRAEQAGKRRLRNLEAEIEGLRDELERAGQESQRLEQTMHSEPQEGMPPGLDTQVINLYKKLNREAKVRELKAKARPWEENETFEEPKNFAPQNLTPGLPFTSKWVSRKVSAPSLSIQTSLSDDTHMDDKPKTAVQVDSPMLQTPASSTYGLNSREQALVSQLLLKIRELEETNSQLAATHRESTLRLRAAQTESESVRRLCEFISDEVDGDIDNELEVLDGEQEDIAAESHDNDPSALHTSSREAMRLRSVGRKTSLDFSSGSTRHSLRLRKFRSMDNIPRSESLASGPVGPFLGDRRPKARKTVLGLFEEDSVSSTHSESSRSYASDPRFSLTRDTGSEDGVPQEDLNAEGSQIASLGSELGLQLHGLRPAPGHVRSRSIMELLCNAEAASPTSTIAPTPSTLAPPLTELEIDTSRAKSQLGKNDESEGGENLPMDERIIYPRLRRAKSSAVFSSTSRFQSPNPHASQANSPFLFPVRSLPSSPITQYAPLPSDQQNAKNTLDKLKALVVELWLWMYFAAVITVFVFSIARQGPKAVLNKSTTAPAPVKRGR